MSKIPTPQTSARLAVSVALLFSAGCEGSPPTEDTSAPPSPATAKAAAKTATPQMPSGLKDGEVRCLGIHECKGQSQCHIKDGHACAGQNDCKGKGWIVVPAADCTTRGGKALEG